MQVHQYQVQNVLLFTLINIVNLKKWSRNCVINLDFEKKAWCCCGSQLLPLTLLHCTCHSPDHNSSMLETAHIAGWMSVPTLELKLTSIVPSWIQSRSLLESESQSVLWKLTTIDRSSRTVTCVTCCQATTVNCIAWKMWVFYLTCFSESIKHAAYRLCFGSRRFMTASVV